MSKNSRFRQLSAFALVTLFLVSIIVAGPVHAQSTDNFNPSNNIVVNGDFSNTQIVHLPNDLCANTEPTCLESFGHWTVSALAYNSTSGSSYPTSDFNYSVGSVDGRNALILTLPPNGISLLLWQTLNEVVVNSSTQYHFAIDYLTPVSGNPIVSFGQFGPIYNRVLTNGSLSEIYDGATNHTRGWQAFDGNIVNEMNYIHNENVLGWYFNCPQYMDVEAQVFTGNSPSGGPQVIALTDFAVYDTATTPQTPPTTTTTTASTVTTTVTTTVTNTRVVTVTQPVPFIPLWVWAIISILAVGCAILYYRYWNERRKRKRMKKDEGGQNE